MSIERLPHKYPIECTDGGQVQFSFGIGLYHLVIWKEKELTF